MIHASYILPEILHHHFLNKGYRIHMYQPYGLAKEHDRLFSVSHSSTHLAWKEWPGQSPWKSEELVIVDDEFMLAIESWWISSCISTICECFPDASMSLAWPVPGNTWWHVLQFIQIYFFTKIRHCACQLGFDYCQHASDGHNGVSATVLSQRNPLSKFGNISHPQNLAIQQHNGNEVFTRAMSQWFIYNFHGTSRTCATCKQPGHKVQGTTNASLSKLKFWTDVFHYITPHIHESVVPTHQLPSPFGVQPYPP